ncbi:MAG: superoxide dismutase family protein [Acidobacteria bacterium]|nr:superoxide dismutase family protein [Acidobacteriota bacterium]
MIAVLFLGATACATWTPVTATAVMEPRSDSKVHGTVTFTERTAGVVMVKLDLSGVPEGVHGFHVHEKGDCSAPDGTSAGSHFNPHSTQHAGPNDIAHHAGDFGNVIAPASGIVKTELVMGGVSLRDGAIDNVIGRGLILHAKRDDLTTQPTGDAGGRIACGVITLSGGAK